ncbi:hypothetical protein DPMN_105980 [Dreissena polymorpha]|uniref:Uncharacterized protein n=1 Tax=Dreissena polymorpha TaxID=45954 RepID=A0A9D4K452_DREPO|nr:hypothetical protein DPMN_105980 [Dreissena polymorpha]
MASRGPRSASLQGLQEVPDLHPCEGFKRTQIYIPARSSKGLRSASLEGFKRSKIYIPASSSRGPRSTSL